MKTLLEKINDEYNALDPEDNSGHVWWNKFREFVKEHDFEVWLNENYRKAVYDGLWLSKKFHTKVYRTEELRKAYFL